MGGVNLTNELFARLSTLSSGKTCHENEKEQSPRFIARISPDSSLTVTADRSGALTSPFFLSIIQNERSWEAGGTKGGQEEGGVGGLSFGEPRANPASMGARLQDHLLRERMKWERLVSDQYRGQSALKHSLVQIDGTSMNVSKIAGLQIDRQSER